MTNGDARPHRTDADQGAPERPGRTPRLGLGEIGFGLLTTFMAAGGLLGTLAYGWITRRVSLGNLMRIGLIIETFTHLGLAVTTIPAVAIFFVFGDRAFVWGTTSVTIRQRAVPVDSRAGWAASTPSGRTAGW